ncbi:MAG: glycosyltransferase [Flavobacteriales bacterium]|nr:glycosyltransferase [Flavobacteriales bacterium]
MKLSVIIVNYNVEYFLEQCINAALEALSKTSGEIIVVDNNSIDHSVEMVEAKFPEIQLIANKENTGFSMANNQAMRIAKGEYVLLLKPDTVVEEDTFIKCVDFMDQHEDCGGLGVKMIDGLGKFLPESKRGLPTPWVVFYKVFGISSLFKKSKKFGRYHLSYLDMDKTHEVEILSGAYMMMRKEALDKVGLLDEDFFMYGEDIDLSYRIIKGGYKNYYFPETRIIHYKGESTKKSSVNYVFVFYRAMIIFAKKHFSEKNANWFSFLINIAIYLRAGLAMVTRLVRKSIIPLIDFGVITSLLYLVVDQYQILKPVTYQWDIIKWAVPAYSATWLIWSFLFGGYDKPLKLFKLLKGVFAGTACILIVYALLPKSVQFSRMVILLGACSTMISYFGLRAIYHFIKLEGYSFTKAANTRFAIVGEQEEVERVSNLLGQITNSIDELSFVYPDSTSKPANYTGNLSQINQIIHINDIDEVIFCAKDLTSRKIIELMSTLDIKNLEYKIAQPESLYLIGSNSIDTSGDLYMVDINSVNLPKNRRAKRIIDIAWSLLLLIVFPLTIWFVKNKPGYFLNCLRVLIGIRTWVGYSPEMKEIKLNLPKIKKGVISPGSIFKGKLPEDKLEKINLIYAKDYRVSTDLKILTKSFSSLGN